METEPDPIAPTSIVFISIFWILIGTFILSIYSRYLSSSDYYNVLGIIPFLIGIGLIIIGWGLLTCRKWAFYSALILSLIGLLILTFSLASMISVWFSYGFDTEMYLQESLPLLFFLGFAAMVGVLIKNNPYFVKKKHPGENK
jgi:hypothetical protein